MSTISALAVVGGLLLATSQAHAAGALALPGPGQPAPTLPGTPGSVSYYNWSGYAVTAKSPFLKVTSTYVQPKVTCPTTTSDVVFWVGFDGFENGTVEQSGTFAACGSGATGHTPTYTAWWEMYPTNAITEMPIKVAPGNDIRDTVTYVSNTKQYLLNVTDVSTGQSYTKTTTCAANLVCQRQSAEWIVERPSNSSGYTPLADWTKMALTADLASDSTSTAMKDVMQPISSFPNNYAITMVGDPDTNTVLAKPSALSASGEQFNDTWLAAQ